MNYFRFLGHFYYHGTLNVPSISETKSIRNWVTFCGLEKKLVKTQVLEHKVTRENCMENAASGGAKEKSCKKTCQNIGM